MDKAGVYTTCLSFVTMALSKSFDFYAFFFSFFETNLIITLYMRRLLRDFAPFFVNFIFICVDNKIMSRADFPKRFGNDVL